MNGEYPAMYVDLFADPDFILDERESESALPDVLTCALCGLPFTGERRFVSSGTAWRAVCLPCYEGRP